ncbi:MAG: GIY-YIG nuclease family protein [Gammaproteobacteria bacterium]|nr:GIY-YIG nuclease family protein [Gammaproteobacteria bacterium]MCY4228465.1 GIY-YIG nuclease family protein [Gammaproteobacteria bacterium]
MIEKTLAEDGSLLSLKWRSKRLTTSLVCVPPKPGLYAFGWDKKSHLGLNAQRTYVYIGQTDNLRRRLGQHLPKSEINSKLKKFLIDHRNQGKCWYCPLPETLSSHTSRLKLEEELIKFFAPAINIKNNS